MGRSIDNRGVARLALVVCALLTLLIAAPAAHAAAATRGLDATYYNDTAMRRVAVKRIDPRVDFNWRSGSPHRKVARGSFGVRWQGWLEAPRKGSYTFTLRASDGVKLWVDGKLRINRWAASRSVRTVANSMSLTGGRHRIRIDFVDRAGPASIQLLWRGPGIRQQVVPPGRLYRANVPVPPQCSDSIDNDGDARTDRPADPDCDSPTDRTESPAPEPAGEPWSDPKTWGGAVPKDGDAVMIPAGKVVLLDQDVSVANLTIMGTLLFARRDLTLETDWMMVHGKLQVGSESLPFTQRAIIRLRDATPNENVMNMGDKFIGVMGGTLELHGPARLGWTRLAANAVKGADRITLATAPDWRPGDRIAIASTDYANEQDEEATVTSVSGTTVTLDHVLEFPHFGTVQAIAGKPVDERAEVALLSRTLTVEGEATSSAGGFGGNIMVMDGGAARIEGTELQRMGQAGILRRYPLHFHMLGDGGVGSYIRRSTVHHSNNRCVTIHGTNQATVADNVCFDEKGHGIFLEDGAEHDNTITGNLVFGTRAPAEGKRILPSDANPGSYWLSNPDNVVRGNVAGGSEGQGFWIALPEHPTGYFAATKPAEAAAMWPRRTALTQFADNAAHSNDGDGLHFDNGPRPDGTTEATYHEAHENPADPKSPELVTTMTNFVGYKNRDHGAWLRGANHRLVGATLADNAIGATFASDETFLQDSLVVGESANKGTPAKWEANAGGVGRDGRSLPRPWDADYPIRGFEFYDGRVGAERTTFANFQPYQDAGGATREQSAIGYHVDDDFSIHPRNFITAATFVNAKRLYLEAPQVGHDGDVSAVFLDTDGSVAGTPGRSIMTNNPFLLGSGCEARADWGAQLCTGDYASLIVGAPGGSPSSVKPVTLRRPDGQVQTLMASSGDDDTDATSSVLTGSTYTVGFSGGTPAKSRFVLYHGRDRWVRVAVPHAATFKVTRYGCNVGQSGSWCFGRAASLAALAAATKSSYFYDDGGDADPATGTMHLKLVSTDSDWDELVIE